jgi:hypothetical protein
MVNKEAGLKVNSLSKARRVALIVRLALLICSVFVLYFLVKGAVISDGEGSKKYAEEVTKGYDFKFGPNPFAPSNVSTTTGGFIPATMFIRRTRHYEACHNPAALFSGALTKDSKVKRPTAFRQTSTN